MKIAVIKTGGKQYKVSENDILKIEKLDTEEGKEIEFSEVLLVADSDNDSVLVGTPIVDGAKVKAKVITQGRSKKTTAFKYKPKVRYRKKIGHRQAFTQIQITSILSK